MGTKVVETTLAEGERKRMEAEERQKAARGRDEKLWDELQALVLKCQVLKAIGPNTLSPRAITLATVKGQGSKTYEV